MVIPNAVEPRCASRVIVYVLYIHHQRVAFPSRARVSKVEVNTGEVRAVVEINVAMAVHKLVGDLNPVRSLCDLERERNIADAGHAGLKAVSVSILGSILEVLLTLWKSRRKIRDHAIRWIHDHALSSAYAVRRSMRLDIPIGGIIQDLPDPAEIRLAI